MTVARTLIALCVASCGSSIAFALIMIVPGGGHYLTETVMAVGIFGLCSFASAMLLVFPFLVWLPRLRTLSYAAASLWGAAVALTVMTALAGKYVSRQGTLFFAVVGAAAGIIYAAAARWLHARPSS